MKEQKQAQIISITEHKKAEIKAPSQRKIASTMLKDGHTMFQYNKETMQLDKAKFEDATVDYIIGSDNNIQKKIIVKKDCFYLSALNVDNAVRKIEMKFNPEFIIVLDDEE